jgi:2-amino-4-hydroxy-6-hydroxymethyldihydropteridine diphosphokinase
MFTSMLSWTRAAIAIGSNLGDRRAFIESAIAWTGATPSVRLVARGPVVETAPLRVPGKRTADLGGPYLNTACIIATALDPEELLGVLLDIERRHHRTRLNSQRWSARTLDLDLLLFGDRVINSPTLTIPHPQLHKRGFVLGPLAAIGPMLVVPGRSVTIAELAAEHSSGERA